MDLAVVKQIGVGLCALGMLGAGIGAGIAANGAAQAMARNPGAEGKIRFFGMLGLVFAELMGLMSFALGMLIMYG